MSYHDKVRGTWVAQLRQGGKVIKKERCKTQAEANLIEANWKVGNESQTLSRGEENDAIAALAILKRHGLSKTLIEAAQFFANHGEHLINTPLDEAWNRYYAVIEGRKRDEKHLRATRLIGKHLKEAFGPKAKTFDLSDTKAVKFLKDWYTDPVTLASKRRQIAAFFNWCAEPHQRYCRPLKFNGDDFPAVIPGAVEMLTARQLQEFFDFVAPHPVYGKFLPCFIIQALTGQRREEIPRIHFEFIDFERKTIRLPARKNGERINKLDKAFVIQGLPDGFWTNFERFRGRTGKILAPHTASETRLRSALAKHTSIKVWPDNAFRHGFATNHISLSDSADKTALLLKHHDATMLYAHYMGEIVPKEEATAYFAVTVPVSVEWITAPKAGELIGFSPRDPRPFRKWVKDKPVRQKPHQTWIVYAKEDILKAHQASPENPGSDPSVSTGGTNPTAPVA